MFSIFTLASGWGVRVVHVDMFVCLSVRVTQKLLLRLTSFFYTRRSIHVAQSSSKMIQIRTPVFIRGFFTIATPPVGCRHFKVPVENELAVYSLITV